MAKKTLSNEIKKEVKSTAKKTAKKGIIFIMGKCDRFCVIVAYINFKEIFA